MKVYIGADWSGKEIVCSVRQNGKEVKSMSVKRSVSAVSLFAAKLTKLCGDGPKYVLVESGDRGWLKVLHAAGFVVYRVDARKAKSFGASLSSSRAKDDLRDARFLAQMLEERISSLEQWRPLRDEYAALDALVRQQSNLRKLKSAAATALRQTLRDLFPALEALIKDMNAVWVFALLKELPTAYHAQRLEPAQRAELAERLKLRGARKAKVLNALAEPWCPMGEAEARIQALTVGMQVAQLELARASWAAITKELQVLMRAMPEAEILQSIAGVGANICAPIIVYGLLELRENSNRDALSILMGASPVCLFSGTNSKGPKGSVQMRYSVRNEAKCFTYLLGQSLRQHNEEARELAQKYAAHGKGTAHINRCIARKFYRKIMALISKSDTYDPDYYKRRKTNEMRPNRDESVKIPILSA